MLMLIGTYFREVRNPYPHLLIVVLRRYFLPVNPFCPQIFTSPLVPWTTLGPLIIVLGLTMLKEGVEDSKRHRSDRRVNNRKIEVISPDGTVREERWQDIKVGQIVRLEDRKEVPADILLLHTSEPRGACYVETSNIDGETNIKVRK